MGSFNFALLCKALHKKGKVESSIKYVKNNFLKAFQGENYEDLVCTLRMWNEDVCNVRIHGTTKRRPIDLFIASEKAALQSLPKSRFQIMHVEHRKVNRMGHLSFRQNYYSVPGCYMSQHARIGSNGTILKVYDGVKQIALHQISFDIGMFISLEAHRPGDKKSVSKKEYRNMMTGVGGCAEAFFDGLVQEVPSHWRKMTQGILSLKKRFTNEQLDIACARALYFHAFSYQHIKGICEKGLFELPKENGGTLRFSDEFQHEFSFYDNLTN